MSFNNDSVVRGKKTAAVPPALAVIPTVTVNGSGLEKGGVHNQLLGHIARRKAEQVKKLLEDLILPDTTIQKIRTNFEEEMDLGLAVNPSKKSSLEMANTFITQLPNGTEDGEYLALDLGGTNFRMLFLQFGKGQVVHQEVKFFHVPEALRLGPGAALFDFLASCIHQFLQEHNLASKKLTLGFTFSFPMEQKSVRTGILVSWTKTFNCPGVVGQDAVKMLNDAIRKRGDLNVEVVAILNDTTGTLVQGAFLDKRCAIGLILGTGSNACYIEKASRVQKWGTCKPPPPSTEVIIDVEYGAFGDNGIIDFIKTEYDRVVDDNSLLPKSFSYEKYISGNYIGEIVRVILLKFVQVGILFDGRASDKLAKRGEFTARHVSMIEADSLANTYDNTRVILDELQLDFGMDDMIVVKYICYTVTNRAAKLVSICLAVLLDRMEKPDVTIGVDGSLFQFHPRLESLMDKYIKEYAPERKFSLTHVEDGSGKGAALVAAIAPLL